MSNEKFADTAIVTVWKYANSKLEKTDGTELKLGDIYVVWFCKTLQNWKALLSTNLPDGMYYEVTFNGNTGEVYLDAYKKFDNVVLVDGKVLDD